MQKLFSWREVLASAKREGFLRSLPVVAICALFSLLGILAIIFEIALGCAASILQFPNPWSRYHKERRKIVRRDKAFAQHPLRPTGDSVGLTACDDFEAAPRFAATSPFFSRLPPDIRQMIMLEAFGDRTLHMSLEFQRPFCLGSKAPSGSHSAHARIDTNANATHSVYVQEEPERWVWFGAVCHRREPVGSTLPLGRLRSHPIKSPRLPTEDKCLTGSADCHSWSGEWPIKCQIGVMGWLLSCRQAYMEGFGILYGANTIHVRSTILLRQMQNILTPNVLSTLTSLELSWDPGSVPLKQGFSDSPGANARFHLTPLFPSMRYLRICLRNLDYTEEPDGGWRHYLSNDWLANNMPRKLDHLVKKLVPATAEVTVSYAEWDWFKATTKVFVERQGQHLTQFQRSELGGVKCWRNMPSTQEIRPAHGEIEKVSSDQSTRGYWIHFVQEELNYIKRAVDPRKRIELEYMQKEYGHGVFDD